MTLAALAACGDDDTGSRGSDLDASVVITCTTGPDAATALGVTGAELWDAFARTYTLVALRQAGAPASATFTITVARSDANLPELGDCTEVAVPVQVTVRSGQPMVDRTMTGVLRGSLLSADVVFATPESMLGLPSGVSGSLRFEAGLKPQLLLRTDGDVSWSTPAGAAP
jgi:hypothetical protein